MKSLCICSVNFDAMLCGMCFVFSFYLLDYTIVRHFRNNAHDRVLPLEIGSLQTNFLNVCSETHINNLYNI